MSSNYIHKVKHFFEPQSYNKHATVGNILTFYQSRTLISISCHRCAYGLSRETPSLPSRKERRREGRKGTIGTRIGTSSFCPSLLPSLSSFFQLAGMAWRDLAFLPPSAGLAWPRERMWATASYNNAHGRRGDCTAPLAVLVVVLVTRGGFQIRERFSH